MKEKIDQSLEMLEEEGYDSLEDLQKLIQDKRIETKFKMPQKMIDTLEEAIKK